jgi:glucuronokinase
MSVSTSTPIVGRAFARVGLMGNPGDAVGGPALAVSIADLGAGVTLTPSGRIALIEPEHERPEWNELDQLLRDVRSLGPHGGRRLMLALIARLAKNKYAEALPWPPPGFTLTWGSSIPRRVGLGGSSALLTAGLRALCTHWSLALSPLEQVKIVLECETKSLGIPAGPMDRVAQVFEGLVFFDTRDDGTLQVESLDPASLPPLFIAIDERASEGTEVFHSNLRERFESGEAEVRRGIEELRELTEQARVLLLAGKGNEIGPLMDRNFDVRCSLARLNPLHEQMVHAAREAGAHAKFAGSGGSIVGSCAEEKMDTVLGALRARGLSAFRPTIRPAVHSPAKPEAAPRA